MEELDGWLYVLDGDSLWRVWPSYGTDPDTWAAAPMPLPAMAGRRIEALAAGGGDLYFVANGIFHRLVSGSGVIASRASAWQAADALLAVAGVVYVSVNGWLHRVQPGGDGVTWQSIPQKLAGMRAHALGMAEGILYVRARSSRRFLSRYGHSLSEVQ